MRTDFDLFVTVLSPRVLLRDEAARVLARFGQTPSLIPERYGYWQPLRQAFRHQEPEAALGRFPSDLLWARSHPSVSGSFSWSRGHQHTAIWLRASSRDAPMQELTGVFRAWASQLTADFGLLHLLSPADVERGIRSNSVHYEDKARRRPFLSVFGPQLLRYCPDLYWATVLGAPYVRLFGRERVKSSPAYRVEELARDVFYVQLTEHVTDVSAEFEQFDAVRQRVKLHLGGNAFFDSSFGPDHEYRVPRLAFPQQGGVSSL